MAGTDKGLNCPTPMHLHLNQYNTIAGPALALACSFLANPKHITFRSPHNHTAQLHSLFYIPHIPHPSKGLVRHLGNGIVDLESFVKYPFGIWTWICSVEGLKVGALVGLFLSGKRIR